MKDQTIYVDPISGNDKNAGTKAKPKKTYAAAMLVAEKRGLMPDTIRRYFGEFTCREDVEKEFKMALPPAVTVLFAAYEYEDYSGDAFVVVQDGVGKLWAGAGSHCSCYGLEGQWEPQDITAEQAVVEIENGYQLAKYEKDIRAALGVR
jgi:hypothetical protein